MARSSNFLGVNIFAIVALWLFLVAIYIALWLIHKLETLISG